MAAITYKCPNCDGGLVFDPASQKYHCEYCLSDFTQEELERLSPEMNRRELEYQEPDCREPNRREPGSAEAQPVLYTCPSCGSQSVTDGLCDSLPDRQAEGRGDFVPVDREKKVCAGGILQ